jgi:hypothetical protein
MSSTETTTAGTAFAQALAAKDYDRISALLDPAIEFRALTPRRQWEADGPAAVIEILRTWFDDEDRIDSLERLEGDSFADRERVGYRLAVSNPEGSFLVEQQAYIGTSDGRIDWMRVVCSGYRPVD